MRVALVHDFLAQDGGAERTLEALHELWPEAPIFVLFHNRDTVTRFNDADVRESVLARLPFARKHYRWYLPMMPFATESYPLKDFDLVISSVSAFAKGILTSPQTLHISYCHTPTRFLWSDAQSYVADLPYNPLIKIGLAPLLHRLRIWDKMSVDRVDHFIANSKTVQDRIQKYYRRDSRVIYPPVYVPENEMDVPLGDYFISGGRFVPYKRFDLLVAAFNRLGKRLVLFGDGPERARLERIAKPNIEFVGYVSDQEKARLLAGAQAFLHPQVEDFGITAVEPMAHGRPVIAFGMGGVTESVREGETGTFFYEQDWAALADLVLHFDGRAWDSTKIREHARQFSIERFKEEIYREVVDRYEEFREGRRQEQIPLGTV